MRIHVTGIGLISAIGNNVQETIASLRTGKTGIAKGISPISAGFHLGAVPKTNAELVEQFNLRTEGSRTALLGMIAAQQAFSGHPQLERVRTGLISGTSVGGMDISEGEYKNFLEEKPHNLLNYRHHPSGTSTEQIAEELGITGFMNTISTACSSAANAIMMGARLHNRICGG
ncbi:MAG: hypothetical protein A3D92_09265 [Bacteroidetes bacterium RIFCSPHIGHO2_02_FULL_44_7]|nr:MAG: hypothetical protein A3D92_09265 [Bacteroidetes bacterium RIFCSPHIGHO2_02_FULL_44_7]